MTSGFNKSIQDRPWREWVRRVILHVPHYFSYEGDVTAGGRQRKVRDIARIMQNDLGWDVVIAQKANSDWTAVDADGTTVVGLKCRLDVYGDPQFGHRTAQLLEHPTDAILYMGGEDAFPFFVKNAKGYHVGVWWDGPNAALTKFLTGIRTQSFFERCRTVACCDANVISWLRTRSRRYQDVANRAIYIPNAVDLDALSQITHDKPATPLRIIFARRFEIKRGPYLLLDAAALMRKAGFPFQLIMSSAVGHDGSDLILEEARRRGIEDAVQVVSNTLDSVMELYAQGDISVVPTIWSEGTSYSAVEALCAGLPVVTTTVGGLPSLVLPGHNGFVCPPKAESIAEAIMAYSDTVTWQRHHRNALSMREALSMNVWNERVADWLKQ
jgi:glycosyltransferase involved in cell wall biosynthesis